MITTTPITAATIITITVIIIILIEVINMPICKQIKWPITVIEREFINHSYMHIKHPDC